MVVYRLASHVGFPPLSHAEEDGLIAVGGDLSPERLVSAYVSGVFPWYSEGSPILWWSPDPRWVLTPDAFRMGRTLRKEARKSPFTFTVNREFSRVIRACQSTPRNGEEGTWITDEMVEAYENLHRLGLAVSAEVWRGDELVGGLYGISFGDLFFGESMFSWVSGASKLVFPWFAQHLFDAGWRVIDCQMETEHLKRYGAGPIPRESFLEYLRKFSEEGLKASDLFSAKMGDV